MRQERRDEGAVAASVIALLIALTVLGEAFEVLGAVFGSARFALSDLLGCAVDICGFEAVFEAV